MSRTCSRAGASLSVENIVEDVVGCRGVKVGYVYLLPRHLTPLIRAEIPLIQVERQDVEQAYSVAIDPLPGMLAAIQTLVNQGHSRIAFVGARAPKALKTGASMPPAQRRVEAFNNAVLSCGLAQANCPTVLGEYFSSDPQHVLPGRQLAETLMQDNSNIVAIVAGSDILAAGVLQVLYERGLKVPEDISIIGYDDSVAQFLSPALSSIAQPYSAIGDAVVDFVEELVEKSGRDEVRKRRVSTSLFVRNSTGAARHG